MLSKNQHSWRLPGTLFRRTSESIFVCPVVICFLSNEKPTGLGYLTKPWSLVFSTNMFPGTSNLHKSRKRSQNIAAHPNNYLHPSLFTLLNSQFIPFFCDLRACPLNERVKEWFKTFHPSFSPSPLCLNFYASLSSDPSFSSGVFVTQTSRMSLSISTYQNGYAIWLAFSNLLSRSCS